MKNKRVNEALKVIRRELNKAKARQRTRDANTFNNTNSVDNRYKLEFDIVFRKLDIDIRRIRDKFAQIETFENRLYIENHRKNSIAGRNTRKTRV